MPRLQYSRNGIVRAVEMSRCAATVFVEGLIDRTFIGAILNENPDANGKLVEIRLARELHASLGNGKPALLGLHEKLKQKQRLLFTLGSNRKAVLFFLDKDIDDLKRTRKRCPHTIYTENYSVENYLFKHGNLVTALSFGACLDFQSLGAFPANQQWTRHAAQSWAEWAAFCVMTARYRTPGVPNFGAHSLIHNGAYSPLDTSKEAVLLTAVSNRTGHPMATVNAAYAKEKARVNEALAANTFDQIFNGKWYSYFLANDAKRIAASRQIPSGLEDRLETALLTTLDFDAGWTMPLHQKISSILSQL